MEKGYIYISNNVFPTLLAISDDEQMRGLMYVEPPVPNMTFIYASPRVNRFWMKNTISPLDIIFCCQGQITQIYHGEPYSTSMIGNSDYSDMIVEFQSGTVNAAQIKVGQKVGLVKPTKNELENIMAKKYHQFVKF